MSSGEKILARIRQETDDKIAGITADADKVYTEAVKKAEKQVQDIKHEGEHKIQLQSDNMLKALKSKKELERQKAILRTKRQKINEAIDHIYKYMTGLGDKAYFDIIVRLASSVKAEKGVIYFCEKDLKRLPADLKERLSKCGVSAEISKEPFESIESGFVLKNGDIEENLSFISIINEKREEIEDIISKELFKD